MATAQEAHGLSVRRACRLVGLSRSAHAYKPRPDKHEQLRNRLKELASEHKRYGYRMLAAKLAREGFQVYVPEQY